VAALAFSLMTFDQCGITHSSSTEFFMLLWIVLAPLARWCWTFAWATYLVHLAMAFHHYHHWSHADAVEHTEIVSGFGKGIYVSHLFTLAWTADALSWWLQPARRALRPSWIDWLLHGFMAFMIFNATVIYEAGPIRWAGWPATSCRWRVAG
jgi:hypothetical protein